jgi:cation:H+ antiporter
MIRDISFIVGGLAGLWIGAELLVRGASTLARRLGMSAMVTGLTVVALGTSMPEFVVSLSAGLQGQGNIAVGNAIGSSIANIGFILGVTALICPIKVQFDMVRFHTPVMLAVSLGFLYVFQDQTVSRAEGIVMAILLVVYIIGSVVYARKEAKPDVREQFTKALPKPTLPAGPSVAFIIVGIVLLAIGAKYLVEGASSVARAMNVSDAVIALTIVALGTSTPELAASLVAAFRGAPDLAAGNIIGSNIFNILGILGVTAALSPLSAPGISTLDIYAMCAMAALFVPILMTGFKVARIEGATLLAVYGGYIYYIWPKV